MPSCNIFHFGTFAEKDILIHIKARIAVEQIEHKC